MKIHSKAFDIIHNLVGQKHFKRLKKEERGHHSRFSPELWRKKREGALILADAIQPFSGSYNIIKTERQRIRKETKDNTFGTVTEIFIVSLLRFIGYSTDVEKLDRDILTLTDVETEEAANILFSIFIQDKFPTYYEDFTYLKEFSNANIGATETEKGRTILLNSKESKEADSLVQENSNILIELDGIKNNSKFSANEFEQFIADSNKKNAKDVFIKKQKFKTKADEIHFNEALVKRMMLEYIDTISKGNFLDGYEYWDSDVRWGKWHMNPVAFASTYFLSPRILSHTKAVFNVHVGPDHFSESYKIHKASCYMYYQANALSIVDKELEGLKNLPIAYHDFFARKLHDFMNRILIADCEELQDVKIGRLLSDNLLFKLRIDNVQDLNALNALFPDIQTNLVNCLYKVHLKIYEGDTFYQWKIKEIVPASLGKQTSYY